MAFSLTTQQLTTFSVSSSSHNPLDSLHLFNAGVKQLTQEILAPDWALVSKLSLTLSYFFWWDEQSINYSTMVCSMMPCQWLARGILHALYIFIFQAGPPPSSPHLQTSNILRFALFWVIMQHIVILYWLFETTNRSQNIGNELSLYTA